MFGAIVLAACSLGGVSAQCGSLNVPENWARPDGRQIALRVAVLPATEKTGRRGEPLFYVTGGPGGVDLDTVPGVAASFAPLNAHHDIVFVDQRGVGGSNPLGCQLATTSTSIAQLVAQCLGSLDADVGHYRTPDAMDDLNAVRSALGYERISLYGASYGATAVQVYLRRHPETVRTVTLDGATLLDVPLFETWAATGQRALKLLDRRCRADPACERAFPHWYARFPALLAKLARHPALVGSTRVDAAATASTVRELTASQPGAVQVPFLLARAESGAYAPLARQIRANALFAPTVGVMPLAIMCTEPWAAADPAKTSANARGTYLAYYQPAWANTMHEVCAAWPQPDAGPEDWSRVRSAVPVLVLAGGADPKDPPANVAGIGGAMPNAKVVTVPGGAHGVEQLGCLPNVVRDFVDAGTARGLDTSCVSLTPYPTFRLR